MDDIDIALCPVTAVSDRHADMEVKSNAIVRFSIVQSAVPFGRLKCNTNLNMPPSNWLSNSANSYGLGQFLSHQAGFSSFRMANMFPDCVGGVDVVSDAENIKRLLKLPYSPKSVISMIVHRIENTLLIDEFDVAKYLLRQEESEWQWLRSFIYENILKSLSDNERKLFLHPKTREAFQQKYLTSKFLYHSLQSGEKDEATDELTYNGPNDCAPYKPLPLAGPVLPEPSKEENLPDAQQTNHVFNRNVIWTFEDIRMLIGTDMPIFGGANRPCISLRLRDETKPINVLTGIDYWLDNLMSNVPEVVMCYHLDGIVQRYGLIKTEDLPRLENSEFSPQLIRNVAQNILAFLKANVTKAGHTYWLFKARNDDVVKLYDLTTLCKAHGGTTDGDDDDNEELPPEEPDDEDGVTGDGTPKLPATGGSPNGQNPFTVPVAMLLYTVARNMKNSIEGGNLSASKAGAIRTLLNNCIKLLPKEKYPQIVTSSHYILSDLHIPADTDPGSPKFNNAVDEEDDESAYLFGERISTPSENDPDTEDDGHGSKENITTNGDDGGNGCNGKLEAAIKSIQDTLKEYKADERFGKHNSRPEPLVCDTAERCHTALQHIVDGLQCLQYFDSYEEQKQKEKEKEAERRKIIHEEMHQNMAKSDSAIPLPYEPIGGEPRPVDPDRVIPMGWKGKDVGENRNSGLEEEKSNHAKGGKKRSKRKERNHGKAGKEDQPNAPHVAEIDPRALLLKGQIGVIKSWNVHLKILLFEKACLVYATMAEQHYAQQRYGTTLHHLYSAIRCQQVVTKYISSVSSQRSLLLGRAGDCFFQLAKQWDHIGQYMEQFRDVHRLDQLIMDELVKDIGTEVENTLPVPTENVEQLMVTSCGCYETAIACASKDSQDELRRRLGSVRNELGVKYMHWAQEEYHKYWEGEPEAQTDGESGTKENPPGGEPLYQLLAKKSYDSLQKGVTLFEAVNDTTNFAFLLCNMGRFMRFRAHIHLVGESPNNVNIQKKFYHEAFTYYQRALGTLGSRKEHPDLWSLVTWELSTATFNLAKQLQDHNVISPDGQGHQSQEEVEQEVVEMLQRALKLCDQDNSGPKQVLYSFRAALIHHRIASYYHMSYRSAADEHRRKTILQLTKLHYEKAAKTFESLAEPQEFLQIQMERIALQEYQCEQAPTTAAKTRHLLAALDMCKQAHPLIEQLASTKGQGMDETPSVPGADGSGGFGEIQKLLELFEKRLQVMLRTLTKLALMVAGGKKDTNDRTTDRTATHYKTLFAVALQKRPAKNAEDIARDGAEVIREYALHLSCILRKICDLDRAYLETR
ncbi:erythroid differentiation-related factor 1 [Anopheles ziemanni]|uniref:erythroid differentiation-related factor 1 n=1 Tax=Anopheles coustani TaxID=139045 RepID=UPI0026589F4B|nr:erythroid differentiation-related factor 1 [Anopheles coustani]XP_058173645.1 erythroid differentiation-related factor 1 [Anopheles ziemanni]